MTSMPDLCFPTDPSALTLELLTAALSIERPGLVVRDLEVVEAPGFFAVASGHFGIALEDLCARGAVFSNVTMDMTLGQVRSLIAQLAALHAKYWRSPTLDRDFGWMATPAGGGMEENFKQILPPILELLEAEPWRTEVLEPIGRSVPELHADMLWVAENALETGPRTLLHGDTHLGNSYQLGDDEMGWLDFQLSRRGCYSRDLTYLLTTSLPIDQRPVGGEFDD